MKPYIQPRSVHERQARGTIFLFGQNLRVSLAEAERVGERIAIMTTEGASEATAQERAYLELREQRG